MQSLNSYRRQELASFSCPISCASSDTASQSMVCSLWSSGLHPLIVPLSLPPQPAVLTSHQLPHPSSPFSTPTGVCTELTNKLSEPVQVDVAARNDGYDLARASPAGESSRNRTC